MKAWYLMLYGVGLLAVLCVCCMLTGCFSRPATAFMAGLIPGLFVGLLTVEVGGILTDSFGKCRWCGKEAR